MNQKKFSKKIEKKYGVSESELANLSLSKIKNLKFNEEKLRQKNLLNVVKKPVNVITKGANIGTAVGTKFAGIIKYGIIGIGAGIGILAYSSYKLIKGISTTICLVNDRHRAKKLTKI